MISHISAHNSHIERLVGVGEEDRLKIAVASARVADLGVQVLQIAVCLMHEIAIK
jgi:hypothetical protein